MFRFTIRDLLWLMVVVAMGCAWYLHYQRLTNQPKLYQDDEILARNRHYFDEFINAGMGRGVVPAGTAMPLSQVFKTLGIDPKRLTTCQYQQYNRGISLSWQLSPSYYLICSTFEGADDTLAFDDPKRTIYTASIHRRENLPDSSDPPVSDTTEPRNTTTPSGVPSQFYTPPWKREPPPSIETLPSQGSVTPVPQDT